MDYNLSMLNPIFGLLKILLRIWVGNRIEESTNNCLPHDVIFTHQAN